MNKKLDALFVSVGIVCMIVGLVALAQSSTPSGGPYYLQVPTSTWTYQIGVFSNGSYHMVNGSNWNVDYQSTNFTKVWNFAGANATTVGGSVFLKSGFYDQGQAYLYLYSNVTYQGEGVGSQINASDGTFLGGAYVGVIVNYNGAATTPTVLDENITLSNIRITGQMTGQVAKSCAISLHHAQRSRITNCWIEAFNNSNGNWGIMLDGGGANTQTFYNTIDHCHFSYMSYDAIHMKDTDSPYGTGCMYNTAESNDIRFCQIGVAFYEADYNTAIGNTVTNMTYLTSSASPAGFWIHECIGIKISDNKVYYSRYGVGYNTIGRGVNYDNIIDHNFFSVMTVSSYAAGIQGGPNTTISENILYYSGTNDGITADTNCVVFGNRIYGASTNEGLIRVSGNNATVKDNTIRSTTTSWYTIYVVGANFTTIRGNHVFDGKGVSIGSGCNNTLVEDNDFNTASTAMSDSGVSSCIRWNVNYKTEGSASANNATTTTWTFTMGNASTVLRAYISFNSTIADPYWSATGNTLTVTTGTIIAANNTACYVEWFCWNYP